MKRLLVEENSGWDPEIRAENCLELAEALKAIAQMIEDGCYSGNDYPLGWDWELHEEESEETAEEAEK